MDRMLRPLFVGLIFALVTLPCFAQSATDQPVAPQAAAAEKVPSPAPQVSPATVPSPAPAATLPTLSVLLRDARSLYRKGDFDGALAKYQEILTAHPQSPDAYAGEVRVYLKQQKVDLAAQTADQALAQSNHARIRVARGEVWFRQGKIFEADKEWVDVANSGYPEARAFLGLARVRNALAMYKTAKKMIDRAHEIDPDDPDIQDEWMSTLSRAERVHYLETTLAGDNDWDPDRRADIASYLEYLKERAKQKSSPCRLVSKVTATETPLVRLLEDPTHLRGYGLTVSLNGHKSSLMLDTGASGILVKRAIAEHAGISKITETKVMGIGKKGRRDAYVGIADSIKIGNLEFQNCPIEVMESRSVAGEDGLIGSDVFQDFLVDIDFPNEKLRLSQLPKRPGETGHSLALRNNEDDNSDDSAPDESDSANSKPAAPTAAAPATSSSPQSSGPQSPGPQDRYIAPEMKSYTGVLLFGHDLLVPTSIGKVPSKLFLLDTGALINFISPAAAREVTKVHNEADVTVEGISGRVDKVYTANKAVLQFGRLRQENQDITAFDTAPLSDDLGTEVSGFLGFVMLRMLEIKIDYRDALIDFQYDAQRWNR
jgi:tetratricopeptide (TPR) repeat protein